MGEGGGYIYEKKNNSTLINGSFTKSAPRVVFLFVTLLFFFFVASIGCLQYNTKSALAYIVFSFFKNNLKKTNLFYK